MGSLADALPWVIDNLALLMQLDGLSSGSAEATPPA